VKGAEDFPEFRHLFKQIPHRTSPLISGIEAASGFRFPKTEMDFGLSFRDHAKKGGFMKTPC
jgi:hypothetical protein